MRDDLGSGHSHFLLEVRQLKEIVLAAAAGRKCFAIFDELFRSTNPEDALAITTATAIGMTAFSTSHFFISTHFSRLREKMQSREKQVSAWYLDCNMEENNPVFTYQICEGWSDLKLGQLIFEQEGLNTLLNYNGNRSD